MKRIINKSLMSALLFLQCYNAAASYDSLFNAFSNAKRGALYQAKAVSDLDNPACPAIVKCLCRLVLDVDTAFKSGKIIDYNGIINNAKSVCSDDTLNALKKYVELKPGESNEVFLKKLYDKSLIIKDVPTPESVKRAGRFDTTNLKDFLNAAIWDKKLFDFGLANITVTDIKSEGGGQTQELFIAKNYATQQEWIIKGMPAPKREAFALSITAQTAALAPIIQPNSRPGFPILSLPIAYLGYNINNNKKGVLAVMLKASGKEFLSYMKAYATDPSDTNKNDLLEAYKLVGSTLGRFHLEYRQNKLNNPVLAPTYTHGDFHARNVFVDLQKKQVYWIDNERIGKTIFQPQAPTTDWEYILFLIFNRFLVKRVFGKDPSEQQKRAWVKTFYLAFINAYLDALLYHPFKKQAAQEMKNMLIGHKKNNEFYDDAVMQEIIKILDGIIQGK